MKKLNGKLSYALYFILVAFLFTSCANEKDFYFKNGKEITADEYFESNSGYETNLVDTFNIVTAEPYGWANADEEKFDNVKYELSTGNIILSVIFSETIIAPLYLTGFEIKEPVRLKDPTKGCH